MMLKKQVVFLGAAAVCAMVASAAYAQNMQNITNDAQCLAAVRDAQEAIKTNPPVGEKFKQTLIEVMNLAQQRCTEKQYKNADELLTIVRTMVASG